MIFKYENQWYKDHNPVNVAEVAKSEDVHYFSKDRMILLIQDLVSEIEKINKRNERYHGDFGVIKKYQDN